MPAWLNPANLLSLARLLAAPWLAYLLIERNFPGAFWLLLGCGLSDFLDGFLARRLGQQSSAGAMLDPVADKVLLVTLYLALGFTGAMPLWLAALVLLRDVFIVLGAAAALVLTRVRSFPPSPWGKLSTFYQFLLAGGVVLYGLAPALVPAGLMAVLMGATVTATLWSGLDYLRLFVRRLRGKERIDAAGRAR